MIRPVVKYIASELAIVSSNERITISVGYSAVNVLLGLLHCDIHISIQAGQNSCITFSKVVALFGLHERTAIIDT